MHTVIYHLAPLQSEWCQLQSPKVGLFFLNKYTGYTQVHPPPGFEHLAEEAGQAGRYGKLLVVVIQTHFNTI